MNSRNYANQKVQSLEAVYPTFPYSMPMTKKSELFEVLSIVFFSSFVLHLYMMGLNGIECSFGSFALIFF